MTLHPTRHKLVNVAMRLFAEKGFNSTSVADILKEANVNSGSLYHYFETKQSLLLAVLEAYRDNIEPMLIDPAWQGVEDPLDRVFALLARYRELLQASHYLYGCPIGNLALELHEPDPAVRKLLAENFNRWTSIVEGCFEAARPKLPADLNSRALAQFTLTTMEGGVMQSRTHRTLEAFDSAVAMLKDYVCLLRRSAKKAKRKRKSA